MEVDEEIIDLFEMELTEGKAEPYVGATLLAKCYEKKEV